MSSQSTPGRDIPAGHSPEPWYVNDQTLILADVGERHARLVADTSIWTKSEPQPHEIADARRIVAAVNACKGMPVEALEANVVQDLVSACESALTWLGQFAEHAPVIFGGEAELAAQLQSVIAKARGN